MMHRRFLPAILILPLLLAGCASGDSWKSSSSIGSLKGKSVEVKEEKIDGSLEKAMASYKHFLESTPETEMTPEALRRLADLKIESVEGLYGGGGQSTETGTAGNTKVTSPLAGKHKDKNTKTPKNQSIKSLEQRSSKDAQGDASNKLTGLPSGNSMKQQVLQDNANSKEAIRIYKELLKKYPDYERNDQVLYQLARAYGIRGEQEKAMDTLNLVVKKYPYTSLIGEVQFRRGEILFVRKSYRQSESAYKAVLKSGRTSDFYTQALYKHGWSLFKQSRYEDGLDSFMRLLDDKAVGGLQAIESFDEIEKQRLKDTLRVVSFSFSYLGGPDAIGEYLKKKGKRSYEDMLFADLGDHYLAKRRYADAANSYAKFVERNPLHERAPAFQMQVIAVYEKGGFPKLVVEGKKDFARIYDLKGTYWATHNINQQPKVLAFIKQNLIDLASHYHALSQKNDADGEHKEAIKWYRHFLASFPKDKKSPEMNFLLAEVLFDNKNYSEAAVEYTKTAYGYDKHPKAAEAGYAAILAHREHHTIAKPEKKAGITRQAINSSLRFADSFPKHPQVVAVLNNAASDMYKRNEFAPARQTAERVLKDYPKAPSELRRTALTVVAHASFDLNEFPKAEASYTEALQLLPKKDPSRGKLVDRLAAAVYKQGEKSRDSGQLQQAVGHFLRVGKLAPDSGIRATAEYDAAAALIQLRDWKQAATVLEDFRRNYRDHPKQTDVTKKLAVAYEESLQWHKAAIEFERIENSTQDPALRREANLRTAELYEKANKITPAIAAYQRFIKRYPDPIAQSIEAVQHLADLYKERDNEGKYFAMLRNVVAIDKRAGAQRTDRTRYLAAMATFELSEPIIEEYRKIRLVQPLKKSLAKKKKYMKKALGVYSAMLDYGVADVTAAATYRTADIYYNFTRALLESDRPKKLSALELEQYDILLEEQAFPFEEKAITLHNKNVQLMRRGIYNEWIEKSIIQLGNLVPIRYAKREKSEDYVSSIY